ncbi:hypothetical protein RJ55_00072 [Drechmeria coniospora]|nr:hypothetical protein RJ55_00072 [Drechmeria coniospora]
MDEASSEAALGHDGASIVKIRQLLRTKDDTQRFVGLALLKSVLDNSLELRRDVDVIQSLWESMSASFLDRLLRTGSKPSRNNAKEMLDLVVSVLHTFASLLPQDFKSAPKFTDRIPRLVGALLYSSGETTGLLLELLHALVTTASGAQALVRIEDLSPLTEIAPSHAVVLEILRFAWLTSMTVVDDKAALSEDVDENMQCLVSSFTGTDGVTLLEFTGAFLRQADPSVLPVVPRWLPSLVGFIKGLVVSRPSPEARSAYTIAAASLLQAYPAAASKLLFTDEPKDGKPFSYMLISLILIDIRSSLPTLLERLNAPEESNACRRLASGFDVICIFIGYLVQSLEDESLETFIMPPDSLLKIRTSISETMSVTAEYLRDRWDASFAGAMGLHPDARAGAVDTSTGSHRTLAWDSITDRADDDPFVLSAIRALALWLREDENELLRKEATGLIDMLMDLYRGAMLDKLDFRSPALVALEALTTLEEGRQIFLRHQGWEILSKDLSGMLQGMATTMSDADSSRAIEIARILVHVVEQSPIGTEEEWMNLVTTVAGCDFSGPGSLSPLASEFRLAALQLCCTLLMSSTEMMGRRFKHSIIAINGIAAQLRLAIGPGGELGDEMEDVLTTLNLLTRRYV